MASAGLYSAFKSYLQDALDGAYSVLDFDQREPALEQGTDPFIALEEDFGTEELVGFGDGGGCEHETAYLTIHVLVPAPQSAGVARTIADTIRDLCRFAYVSDDGYCKAVSPPDPERLNRGLWSAVYFTATLSRYFHAARPVPLAES